MKRALVTLIVIGLVAGALSLPADAKKRKKRVERTVEATYNGPGIGARVAGNSAGGCSPALALGCVAFTPGSTETFIKVEIADQSGQAVAGSVNQDSDPNNPGSEQVASFCTKTPQAVAIDATLDVTIFFFDGTCDDGSPSFATQGTITATFSNLP